MRATGCSTRRSSERGRPASRRSRRSCAGPDRGLRGAAGCRSQTSRRCRASSLQRARPACGSTSAPAEPAQHAELIPREAVVPGHRKFRESGRQQLPFVFLPIIGHSADGARTCGPRQPESRRSPDLYPPNILPAEIRRGRPDRVRALFVDSANPMMSGADTAGLRAGVPELELLVVVDVAMTETARLAHYVLPASHRSSRSGRRRASTSTFPENAFTSAPRDSRPRRALPSPRILHPPPPSDGRAPDGFPCSSGSPARSEARAFAGALLCGAVLATMALRPKLRKHGRARASSRRSDSALPRRAPRSQRRSGSSRIGYVRRHARSGTPSGAPGRRIRPGRGAVPVDSRVALGTVVSEHRYEDAHLVRPSPRWQEDPPRDARDAPRR